MKGLQSDIHEQPAITREAVENLSLAVWSIINSIVMEDYDAQAAQELCNQARRAVGLETLK